MSNFNCSPRSKRDVYKRQPIDILSSRAQMKKRYGFVYVNRDNKDLKDMKRIKKKSFEWFKHVIETNGEEL